MVLLGPGEHHTSMLRLVDTNLGWVTRVSYWSLPSMVGYVQNERTIVCKCALWVCIVSMSAVAYTRRVLFSDTFCSYEMVVMTYS